MNLHDSTTNELINFANDRELVDAMLLLGEAYKARVAIRGETATDPAAPWARVGDQMFVYTSTAWMANKLEGFVTSHGPTTFPLKEATA